MAGENLLIPVHSCTRSIYTLNPVACELWELIEQPRSEQELIDAIADRYRIPAATAQPDVRAFLDDLVRMGLVERQPDVVPDAAC